MEIHSHTIIGWGLAGTCLAWEFYFENIQFSVIDQGSNESSHVAAGLINPIVFKRLTKSWMADELIPYSDEFYTKIGGILSCELLTRLPINRIFASLEEKNNWATKDEESYIGEINPIQNAFIENPLEAGKIWSLGGIHPKIFIDKSKQFFENKGISFQNTHFNFKEIDPNEKYIFCEGIGIIANRFFNYLPMKPTHGDILTIKSTELKVEEIINKNMFIMPIGNDEYKVGATYNWELREAKPSEAGKLELIEKLKSFTHFKFEIVNHEAGIRPTVSDRRPLLGQHPEYNNLFIFNGLGTKGVMLAPYFAHEILGLILHDKPVNKEVCITRFERHYKQEVN